ncbi:hypothetical protein [Clostridium sp.]|uniref:hypothetical protein n=1 Tax=Clostridium sp. TaxID=1506 RepID=UPI0028524A2A|nr:hypothetical protein [Clostridium sp.]
MLVLNTNYSFKNILIMSIEIISMIAFIGDEIVAIIEKKLVNIRISLKAFS